MDKTIAIHQPNFFPWLGYFDKIVRADVFIFFDNVQFPKTGGTWSNRVKLLIAGEARWVTAAVDRHFSGTRSIKEMSFLAGNPWREKVLKSIVANYGRHRFFGETMDIIEPLVTNSESSVAEFNIHAITQIAKKLGLNIEKFRRASNFSASGCSNELLCSLTKLSEGSMYMCGGGADGYQDATIFELHGIKLVRQNFLHPVYPQRQGQDFVAGLSVIDAAMNLGWRGASELLLGRHSNA